MIEFELCRMSDKRYQKVRDNHYIPNKGTHGQQLHFLIKYNDIIVGIISGASSVYGVKERDLFFNIPKDQKIKQKLFLPAIINNTVFRLEYHEKNLATQILSKWRKIISLLWEEIYDVPVIGFETFVIETDFRKGTLYKADNWFFVGKTKGNTKQHNGLKNKQTRLNTDIKLIYCRWNNNKNKVIIPTKEYISSWKNETDIEKIRSKKIKELKDNIIGKIYV